MFVKSIMELSDFLKNDCDCKHLNMLNGYQDFGLM